MLEKYLNKRFIILYLTPFIIGLLTVFSFQPFNVTLLNFFILPIFFLLTVYINKKYIPNKELMDETSMVGPNENFTDSFINRMLYPDHYYLHNYDTLSRILIKCGFSEIEKKLPGDTKIDDKEILKA